MSRKATTAGFALAALVGFSSIACTPGESNLEAQKASSKEGQPEVTDAKKAKKLVPDIEWEAAYTNLKFSQPVAMIYPPKDDKRLFVVEKFGKVKVFERKDDVKETKEYLDVTKLMLAKNNLHNEEGLLSMVFHPDYAKNGYSYVYYTEGEVTGKHRSGRAKIERRSVIARFTVDKKDPNKVDPKSHKVIFKIEQPWGNHNGATMLFGEDGFLYISVGDGGAGGDPKNSGQDMKSMLGKILRIDVDKKAESKEYSVPKDNPFVKKKDVLPEVWAYGLRNVWRMSFDRKTGELWAGDVGQNKWEEISLISKGGNYGWRVKEGFHDFKGKEAKKSETYIAPIVNHNRKDAISITGGYVYRGKASPTLDGVYFYGDYVTKKFWGLKYEKGKLKAHRELTSPKVNMSSFAEDQDGEIYAINYSSWAKLLRLKAKPVEK